MAERRAMRVSCAPRAEDMDMAGNRIPDKMTEPSSGHNVSEPERVITDQSRNER